MTTFFLTLSNCPLMNIKEKAESIEDIIDMYGDNKVVLIQDKKGKKLYKNPMFFEDCSLA